MNLAVSNATMCKGCSDIVVKDDVNCTSSKNDKIMNLLHLFTFLLILFLQKPCFAHNWMAPEDAAKRKNPLPITNESVTKGQSLFTEFCASCHGINASGISSTETGLSVDTPNLPNRLKTHTDGDFHWKILNGKGDMPSFKEELSEKETWDIVNYIRSLIKK